METFSRIPKIEKEKLTDLTEQFRNLVNDETLRSDVIRIVRLMLSARTILHLFAFTSFTFDYVLISDFSNFDFNASDYRLLLEM